ncbi:hypothetical protein Bbelb_136830 [Branchiostoma belcheri]|nr:hypothetical protein Bbelb_136830 [Branchiostoma belcheri]
MAASADFFSPTFAAIRVSVVPLSLPRNLPSKMSSVGGPTPDNTRVPSDFLPRAPPVDVPDRNIFLQNNSVPRHDSTIRVRNNHNALFIMLDMVKTAENRSSETHDYIPTLLRSSEPFGLR